MIDNPKNHAVIIRAIDYIDGAIGEKPQLAEVANAVGLSSTQFQQVFSQWTGVSPKKYQRYLTLNHAKSLLKDRFKPLDVNHNPNLNGTSHLHDLFLSWEAMNPWEFSVIGHSLIITWGWFDSPFGELIISATPSGICSIGFTAKFGRDWTLADVQKRWPKATYIRNETALRIYADAIIDGDAVKLHLIGAPFQIKVWKALLNVPTGHVTTYGEIAKSIGRPKANRAVGTAVGQNPIGWLIPCHRVLRKSGELGGYHWGLQLKRSLLAREGARADADTQLESNALNPAQNTA